MFDRYQLKAKEQDKEIGIKSYNRKRNIVQIQEEEKKEEEGYQPMAER